MDEEPWIVIPNWDRFQHYKDRDPAWIKDYVSQHSDDDYLGLSLADRGLLHDLRLLYAASDGRLRCSRQNLTSRLGVAVKQDQLERLNHAGLIEFSASKPLALARSREKRREEENSAPLAKPPKPATSDTTIRDFTRVGQMIRNGVITDPVDLAAEIAGYELPPELADSLRDQLERRQP